MGDINGDGRDEIVIGTSRTSLYAIDPSAEGRMWSNKLGHDVTGVEIVTGSKGRPLIVAGSRSQFVSAFNGAGEKQWSTPVGAPVMHLTTAGSSEDAVIVAALKDGSVVVLSTAGTITHRGRLKAQPVALTVTTGQHPMILIADENGVVTALRIR